MATVAEKTVTATEFKAKCLDLMDQLAARTLDRVLITKRGRVVTVALPPPEADRPRGFAAIHGAMKDWPSPVPEDYDWSQPLFTDEELEGFIARKEKLLEDAMRRPRG